MSTCVVFHHFVYYTIRNFFSDFCSVRWISFCQRFRLVCHLAIRYWILMEQNSFLSGSKDVMSGMMWRWLRAWKKLSITNDANVIEQILHQQNYRKAISTGRDYRNRSANQFYNHGEDSESVWVHINSSSVIRIRIQVLIVLFKLEKI
jgi:hypothetical protein